MMNTEGHIEFGDVYTDLFNVPEDYRMWATAPDYGYWANNCIVNKALHRFTLHGAGNVFTCINKLKDNVKFPYNTDDVGLHTITNLVLSHTLLDMFNAPVFPSFPHSSSFLTWRPQYKEYAHPNSQDPPRLGEVYTEMLDTYMDERVLQKDLMWAINNPYDSVLTTKLNEHYKEYKW